MKLLCATVFTLAITTTSFADTWTVDDDGKADFSDLQDAVSSSSHGDEIIVFPGTYTGTGDNIVDMKGKRIWLHSSDGPETNHHRW